MRPRVSMAAVAALANVSGQTVSRVVNGSARVDPATRTRVEAAMTELGYRPHRAARALRTGRSHTIGLVVTTLATVGNSHALQAAAVAAEARGYAITVVTVTRDIAAALGSLEAQGVDGVLVLNEASALLSRSQRDQTLNIVAVDTTSRSARHVVQSDHVGGALTATEHLLSLGHEAIWHLAGPEGSFAAAERERGWQLSLASAGHRPPPVVRGDWSAESGFRAAGALLGASAVFCANDEMALGLMHALAEHGRSVPEHTSIVGFDDVPGAAHYLPPLTTVRQDFLALANHAVTTLIDRIEGDADENPSRAVIPTQLIIRASTRAARSPHSTAIGHSSSVPSG